MPVYVPDYTRYGTEVINCAVFVRLLIVLSSVLFRRWFSWPWILVVIGRIF